MKFMRLTESDGTLIWVRIDQLFALSRAEPSKYHPYSKTTLYLPSIGITVREDVNVILGELQNEHND